MIRPVAVALLALLLTGGQASAECAWVLWGAQLGDFDTDKTLSEEWHVINASKAEALCKQQLKITLADRLKYFQKEKNEGRIEEIQPSEDGLFLKWKLLPNQMVGQMATARFVCLPDTVDPRGPKGK